MRPRGPVKLFDPSFRKLNIITILYRGVEQSGSSSGS